MDAEQAEQLLEYVLRSMFCRKHGCWPDGFKSVFQQLNNCFMLSAWPTIDAEDGRYDAANFDLRNMLVSINNRPWIRFHYSHQSSLLQMIWIESNTYLVLNVFADPPDEDVLHDVAMDGHGKIQSLVGTAMGKVVMFQADDTEEEQKDAGNQLATTIASCINEIVAQASKQVDAVINYPLVCDLLIMAGKRVSETELITWPKPRIMAACQWAMQSLSGELDVTPPKFISRLESLVG